MEDREGFEPSRLFQVYTLSRRARSTTLASVRVFWRDDKMRGRRLAASLI